MRGLEARVHGFDSCTGSNVFHVRKVIRNQRDSPFEFYQYCAIFLDFHFISPKVKVLCKARGKLSFNSAKFKVRKTRLPLLRLIKTFPI